MTDRVTLKVDGRLFEGWTACEVARGIDAVAGGFSLVVSDRDPSRLDEKRNLTTGQACEVLIGGEVVISGHIDSVAPDFSSTDHRITVTGRGRTADLVDSSAVHRPGSWSGRTIVQIAAELAKPFDVKVTATTSAGAAFARFALQPGETVIEALGRAAAFRGVLLIETPAGNLEIATPASKRSGFTLSQGGNILSGRALHNAADRFSKYIVKGQSAGDDHVNGAAAAGVRGEAADPAITRYRPLIVLADDQATTGGLKTRAAWEATVRAGKSQSADIELQGWRDPSGAIWAANQLVGVDAPWLNLQADMLVCSVRYSLDEGGSTTMLTLAPPEAFTQMKVPASAEAGRLKGKVKGK